MKVRDYLAKGIPIITVCHEDAFEKERFKYSIEYPSYSLPIEYDKIVKFSRNIYQNKESIHDIRI